MDEEKFKILHDHLEKCPECNTKYNDVLKQAINHCFDFKVEAVPKDGN